MTDLQTFLEAKPLFYDEIDLERMPQVYLSLKSKLSLPKVIHIVGTNGKGTTGRFLANGLLQNGLSVGHYTSPHILNFNERIWRDGKNASEETLEKAHQKLLTLLSCDQAETLSYFEYTTLLAMLVYDGCDYVVLEAGLGGEYDATNVFDKTLSLFTPIDQDHQAFLGNTINEIASTKLRSMQSSAILGFQVHKEVATVFDEIARDQGCNTNIIDDLFSFNAQLEIREEAQTLPSYLQDNLLLALSALKFLGLTVDVKALASAPLFGRLTRIRPNVLLDVGHNLLAAKAIANTLKGEKYILVYNSYRDKDYEEMMKTLAPIVEHVELISVYDVRIEQKQMLEKAIRRAGLEVREFAIIEDNKQYLVFGSFSVAEAFLHYLKL